MITGMGGVRVPVDNGCICPQPLDIIKITKFLAQNVYYHIAIVQQDPAGLTVSLDPVPLLTQFFIRVVNFIRDRTNMSLAGSGSENKKVRYRGQDPQVKNGNGTGTTLVSHAGTKASSFIGSGWLQNDDFLSTGFRNTNCGLGYLILGLIKTHPSHAGYNARLSLQIRH